MDTEILTKLLDKATDWVIQSGGKLLIAILVLWIGWYVIKFIRKMFAKALAKREIDASLRGFFITAIDAVLKVLLIITAMSMVGIEVTSFIAILGAAGLAVGIALQGTLQNFAGGVIILLLRPYKVGDYIETGSFSGSVKHIQIFHTLLTTPDNKQIIIPNSELATKSLINYTKQDTRRVDFHVEIAYGEPVEKTRELLLNLATSEALVIQEEALKPVAVTTSVSDNSVTLSLRVWTKTENYWDVDAFLRENIYKELIANNIQRPSPQLQVSMANK